MIAIKLPSLNTPPPEAPLWATCVEPVDITSTLFLDRVNTSAILVVSVASVPAWDNSRIDEGAPGKPPTAILLPTS